MNHLKLLAIILNLPGIVYAQVGIGTTAPDGKLTIDASADTTAALELIPQPVPTTNLAAGQLAVIGDQLYMYDTTRSKWLTVATIPIPYAENGGTDDETMKFGDMRSGNSGAAMPLDGTIVHISGTSSGGEAGKDFDIIVRNGNTNQSVNTITFTGNDFTQTNTNIDFSAGDYFRIDVDAAGGDVNNPTIILWVKWRQ